MAVLLKHHGLGRLVISLLSPDGQTLAVTPPPPAPRCLVDVCKIVHQARTALIKVFSIFCDVCDSLTWLNDFCLTNLFSWRLFQIRPSPPKSTKEEPLGIAEACMCGLLCISANLHGQPLNRAEANVMFPVVHLSLWVYIWTYIQVLTHNIPLTVTTFGVVMHLGDGRVLKESATPLTKGGVPESQKIFSLVLISCSHSFTHTDSC